LIFVKFWEKDAMFT